MKDEMYVAPEVRRSLSAGERAQLRRRMSNLADCAAARFRYAVRPIYGATKDGEPNHIGSAILLDIRGVKILLTAAHVVDANDEMSTTLYVGGTETRLVKIEADFKLTPKRDGDRDNDQYDFAVAAIPTEMIEQLGSDWITEGDIELQVRPGHLYTAIGFPNSKNRWFNRETRKTIAKYFCYSSSWRFSEGIAKRLAGQGGGEHHVFLGYNKHSRSEDGFKVSSVAPRGLSGGAIIDAGAPGDLKVFRQQIIPVPLLIGMTVERWKEHQVLIGTRMSVILRVILDQIVNPSAAPSVS